jgi:hypothetical protein
MNALDLRADHPELLGDYRQSTKRHAQGVAAVVRRFTNNARVKPVGAR